MLEETLDKALAFSGVSREELAYRVLPQFFLELIEKYLRVQVEGARYLPKRGPYIVIANHSGYMGFDALMLSHELRAGILVAGSTALNQAGLTPVDVSPCDGSKRLH